MKINKPTGKNVDKMDPKQFLDIVIDSVLGRIQGLIEYEVYKEKQKSDCLYYHWKKTGDIDRSSKK